MLLAKAHTYVHWHTKKKIKGKKNPLEFSGSFFSHYYCLSEKITQQIPCLVRLQGFSTPGASAAVEAPQELKSQLPVVFLECGSSLGGREHKEVPRMKEETSLSRTLLPQSGCYSCCCCSCGYDLQTFGDLGCQLMMASNKGQLDFPTSGKKGQRIQSSQQRPAKPLFPQLHTEKDFVYYQTACSSSGLFLTCISMPLVANSYHM